MEPYERITAICEILNQDWEEAGRVDWSQAEELISSIKSSSLREWLVKSPAIKTILDYAEQHEDWDSEHVAQWPEIVSTAIEEFDPVPYIVANGDEWDVRRFDLEFDEWTATVETEALAEHVCEILLPGSVTAKAGRSEGADTSTGESYGDAESECDNGLTIGLYARHEDSECPIFGVLEARMNRRLARFLCHVSSAASESGFHRAEKRVPESLDGLFSFIQEGEARPAEIHKGSDGSVTLHAVGASNGDVMFSVCVPLGREFLVFESDLISSDTLSKLYASPESAPDTAEVRGELCLAGELDNNEAYELCLALHNEGFGRWPELAREPA